MRAKKKAKENEERNQEVKRPNRSLGNIFLKMDKKHDVNGITVADRNLWVRSIAREWSQ